MYNHSLVLTQQSINRTALNNTLLLLQIYNPTGTITRIDSPKVEPGGFNYAGRGITNESNLIDPILSKILASIITVFLLGVIFFSRVPNEEPILIICIYLTWVMTMVYDNQHITYRNDRSTSTS